MTPAGRELRARECHANADRVAPADEVEQRAPTTTDVQHARSRPEPDLLGDILVLVALRLLEGEREIAVVLRPAEVRQLAHAEPENLVGQGVGEVDVVARRDAVPACGSRKVQRAYCARAVAIAPGSLSDLPRPSAQNTPVGRIPEERANPHRRTLPDGRDLA